jgi:hypothetical protein
MTYDANYQDWQSARLESGKELDDAAFAKPTMERAAMAAWKT